MPDQQFSQLYSAICVKKPEANPVGLRFIVGPLALQAAQNRISLVNQPFSSFLLSDLIVGQAFKHTHHE